MAQLSVFLSLMTTMLIGKRINEDEGGKEVCSWRGW